MGERSTVIYSLDKNYILNKKWGDVKHDRS